MWGSLRAKRRAQVRDAERCTARIVQASALPVVGHGENDCPKHLILRSWCVNRSDAHASGAFKEQIGAMPRRIAPAGESLRQSMITGADVLGGMLGAIALGFEPLIE